MGDWAEAEERDWAEPLEDAQPEEEIASLQLGSLDVASVDSVQPAS